MTDTPNNSSSFVTVNPQACKEHLEPLGLCLAPDPKNGGMLRFNVVQNGALVPDLRGHSGPSEVQVDMLALLNKTLEQAVDDALDAACLPIQSMLGMAGDFAGVYFSGTDTIQPFNDNIARYMMAEITFNWND